MIVQYTSQEISKLRDLNFFWDEGSSEFQNDSYTRNTTAAAYKTSYKMEWKLRIRHFDNFGDQQDWYETFPDFQGLVRELEAQ